MTNSKGLKFKSGIPRDTERELHIIEIYNIDSLSAIIVKSFVHVPSNCRTRQNTDSMLVMSDI